MSLKLVCECGKHLEAPDSLAGKRGKCPACGRAFCIQPGKLVDSAKGASRPSSGAIPAIGHPSEHKVSGPSWDPTTRWVISSAAALICTVAIALLAMYSLHEQGANKRVDEMELTEHKEKFRDIEQARSRDGKVFQIPDKRATRTDDSHEPPAARNDDQCSDGETALARATKTENAQMVEKSLSQGASPNEADATGNTPIVLAVEARNHEIVKALLRGGADPNSRDKDGRTVLVLAAMNGSADIARSLLNGGADVDRMSTGGSTALQAAVINGFADVVQAILIAGANANLQDSQGVTPLSAAVSKNHVEVARMLLNGGADPDLPCNSGNTPLMIAASRGHAECVDVLLERHVDVDAVGAQGSTALTMAVSGNHREIVARLKSASRRHASTGDEAGEPAHRAPSETTGEASERRADMLARIAKMNEIISRTERTIETNEHSAENMSPSVNQMSAYNTLYQMRQQLREMKKRRTEMQNQLANPDQFANSTSPSARLDRPAAPSSQPIDPRSVAWDVNALARVFRIIDTGYDASNGRVTWLLESRAPVPFCQLWAHFMDQNGVQLKSWFLKPPMMLPNRGQRVQVSLNLNEIGGIPPGTVKVVITD
jgi:ankyrin repeat protein